jgi:acyl-CoA synthetase (AMP-forming)/AMP-acid ligase II/NAD(P)-dependent dehydrogenase (short-subunit alcohol dehydrogenase family)/acyl carrier protein
MAPRTAPLSRAQEAMAFLCRLAEDPAVYHLPSAVRLRGRLEVSALREALDAIVARHEILRTTFPLVDGRPIQRALEPGPVELPLVELPADEEPLARLRALAAQPLDPQSAPPWRATLLRLHPDEHILLFVHHHLVWDGWSIGLMIAELAQGYEAATQGRAPSLPALPMQYADYATWEREQHSPVWLAKKLAFWREAMKEQQELLLPLDRPRPDRARHQGSTLPLLLPELGPFLALCRAEGCTLFMGLLAAFGAVLSRWSGQEAFPLGTPVANRGRAEHLPLIGYFANILVLPLELGGEPGFRELLGRTRRAVLDAFQHQDLPFDALVDGLGSPRDARRNPIFQVMLALHAESLERLRLPGLEVEPVAIDAEQTHFDLGLHLWQRGEQLQGYLSYDTALFDAATVQRLLGHLHRLIQAACAAPEAPLATLDILDPAERAWLEASEPTPAPDPERWRQISPIELRAELDSPSADPRGLLVCGGPLPTTLARRALASLDRPLAYGLPGLLAWQPVELDDPRWASPGRADRRRVRVLDVHGALCPIGVWGRPCIDGEVLPERARWRADGRLELDPTASRQPLYEGARVDLDRIGASLARQAGLAACWVGLEEIEGAVCFIVRAVAARRLERERVQALASALLPGPVRLGFCTRLPTDRQGRVDPLALRALPLLDPQGVERLGLPAASLGPDRAEPPALHLWELVPELRRTAEVQQTSSIEQGQGEEAMRADLPLAWARGAPLTLPPEAPSTLAQALQHAAERSQHTGQGLCTLVEGQPRHRDYATLREDALGLLGALQGLGLLPGDRLVLQLPVLADHFTAFWACVLGGITPVTVAPPPTYDQPGAVLDKLVNAWRLLGRPPVLTQADRCRPLAQAAVRAGAEAMRVLAFEELAPRPGALPYEGGPLNLVFFQLTSGSTGIPKVVPETNRAVLHQAFAAAAFNGYGPQDVSVNWLPLDHVVPTLTSHLRDVVLGITQVHAETAWVLADPLRWLDLLEAHRATLSWSPNFGFKLVAEALAAHPERSWDLSALRFIMNAGEQVTLPVVREFLDRTARFGLGEGVMQPAYGMAEVATAVTFRSDFRLESASFRARKASLTELLEEAPAEAEAAVAFIDNGPPIPGVELRIAGPQGQVLPERMIGRIQMRGPVVNPGYLDNPEANAEAFVGEGWFDSGDLGFLHRSHLFITGRRKEVIIVRGANFYCYEIEDIVGGLPGVEPTFAAATAVDDPASGSEGLAIFFVPRQPGVNPALLQQIRERVGQRLGLSPSFLLPLRREELPKTTSGKLQRGELKRRLAEGGFDERLMEVDRACGAPSALPAWFFEPCWVPCPAPPSAAERPVRILDLPADGRFPSELRAILAEPEPPRLLLRGPPGWGGLIGTLLQEHPGLDARLIEGAEGTEEEARCEDREPWVRWRGGRREVRRLAPARPGGPRLPLKQGGRYLLSGGLGGLGLHIARLLLRRFQAQIVLLSSRPLDSEDSPAQGLARQSTAQERQQALDELRRLPGSVELRCADVADPLALAAALQDLPPFDGAFHLAGRFPIRTLAEEEPPTWQAVLDPKLRGFDNLDALLPPQALLVSAGSVYGELGTLAGGAYAVANSMLAERARRRAAAGRPTRHLDWSHWDETGLSREFAFREQARALGLQMMEPGQALSSLLAALAGSAPALLVGLDARAPHLAWRCTAPARPAEVLCLDGQPPSSPLRDPFGLPIPVQGGLLQDTRARGPRTAPSTSLERSIAAAWGQVLGLDRVDIDTTFFALGGQSIQLVQVLALLETSLDRKLSVVDLFRYPTVRSLAASLAETSVQAPQQRLDEAQQRGERQRQVARQPPAWSRRR